MKFSLLIAIVDDTIEDKAIDIAKTHGAGGVTSLKGAGIGLNEKKTFFGLTYERAEAVLIFVLEKQASIKVMKALKKELDLDSTGKGIVMTMPIEHLAGIDVQQVERFQNQIKDEEV